MAKNCFFGRKSTVRSAVKVTEEQKGYSFKKLPREKIGEDSVQYIWHKNFNNYHQRSDHDVNAISRSITTGKHGQGQLVLGWVIVDRARVIYCLFFHFFNLFSLDIFFKIFHLID